MLNFTTFNLVVQVPGDAWFPPHIAVADGQNYSKLITLEGSYLGS